MKEESQLADMRAALLGDRERAEQARQRSTENVRALTEAPPMAQQVDQPTRAAERHRRALRGLFKRR